MAKSKTDPRTPNSYPVSEPQDYHVLQLVLLSYTCIYCLFSTYSIKRALNTIRKHQFLSPVTPHVWPHKPLPLPNLDGRLGALSTTAPRHAALTAHLVPVL